MANAPGQPSPADYVAINELLARYCVTLDLDDVEGWLDLFAPDASYDVDGRTYQGRETLRRLARTVPRGLHLAGPPIVETDGPDRARTTRNALFVNRHNGTLRHTYYVDDLVRTGEGWRIAACRCRFVTSRGVADWPDGQAAESLVHGVDTPDWADA
ncbi:nuclear transport factor 2 family protein [Frankia sp. CNm7]|uniref:Nuclear transport factor 2 family protein n=1 Tax=Frankia nepalensis TaxID=1836974 RepID=A0A937RKZ4_9ACTN|nr:nuclear transport factor 2 family protein [Frankia nepalensis]MBL7501776.1 nuclear transport factor 2 family protein [Frankia nepalensis]MBL7515167.1 nuclear transport factor 2 family protein [Frankia nepalensis]MBL7524270.1 nuclear transport factor 2 family protein [Frankia nepalensis]MBL7629244.1 nuclear transport factor 2 family protein [Frankia nepalensis]